MERAITLVILYGACQSEFLEMTKTDTHFNAVRSSSCKLPPLNLNGSMPLANGCERAPSHARSGDGSVGSRVTWLSRYTNTCAGPLCLALLSLRAVLDAMPHDRTQCWRAHVRAFHVRSHGHAECTNPLARAHLLSGAVCCPVRVTPCCVTVVAYVRSGERSNFV